MASVPRLNPGPTPNYGRMFAQNRKAYARSTFKRGGGRVSGGTFGRTGRTARNVAWAKYNVGTKAKIAGIKAGRVAGSTAGRAVLSAGGLYAHMGAQTYSHSRKMQKQGFTKAQIKAARTRANYGGNNGMLRTMAGSYLATLGGQAIGRKGLKARGNIIAGAAIVGGHALTHSGVSAYNRKVEKNLKSGQAKRDMDAAKARVQRNRMALKGAAKKVGGMSRSQAARIAAMARWHGRGGKK